jgi:hypothetical protein|nr:MAG TPA: SF2-N [Caudoviricetes sp.]
MEKVWVSDIISNDEIAKWEPGDIVTIRAKTGDGKSFFVKNKLYEYAKAHGEKILLLLHRENTINQFQYEVDRESKDDTIDIRTYQFYEQLLLYGRETNLSQYKYIVVDEAHYFVSDSAFNNRTDLSFEAVLQQNNSVRIFMSATIDDIQSYINIKRQIQTIDYEIPQNYSHIQSLTFFGKDDMLDELAKRFLESGEKAIFFIHRARTAYELYKRFRDVATFNCSKSNSLYCHVDEEAISAMLSNERFETPFLITTACFDSGANIIDTEVKHIVIDMKDVDTVIQCAGRKRVQSDDDMVHLYIRNITNQQLGGFESASNRKLAMARYLLANSTEELLKKYPRQNDASGVIYDVLVDGKMEKRVNQLMFLKKAKDVALYGRMKNLGDYGFSKYISKVFGFYDAENDSYTYQVAKDDFGIKSYLERMVGVVMLGRADRKELIDKLDVRQDGHQLKGIDSINAALRERHLPFQVKEFSTSRLVDGKKKNYKSAWRIEKED